jgi:hypothetical protein
MSKEHPQPQDVYGFTEREQLWDRITDERFSSIIADEQTQVHRIELSSNTKCEKHLRIQLLGILSDA